VTVAATRQITNLARLRKHLRRSDLERRGPLRLEKFRDLPERKFKRCTVIGLAGFIRCHTVWLCRCKCGAMFMRECVAESSNGMRLRRWKI